MNQDSEETATGDPEPKAVTGHADRPPTDEEARAADEQFADDSDEQRADVAKHEKEMMEIGADVKGEGAIE